MDLRKAARVFLWTGLVAGLLTGATGCRSSSQSVCLENEQIKMCLSDSSGLLAYFENKKKSEQIRVREEDFGIEGVDLALNSQSAKLTSIKKVSPEVMEVIYGDPNHQVDATAIYSLGRNDHFLQKKLRIQTYRSFGWKRVTVGTFNFAASNLTLIKYPHQKSVTYFGRSNQAGVFLGLEKPFDFSSLENKRVTLGYAPSLKVKADELIDSEPIYLGVYSRSSGEREEPSLPLRSESEAMVEMTSRLLGPPRHGFAPIACGWWCEMEHYSYKNAASLQADMRSIDFVRDLGIDRISDNHPWGGETDRMNGLRETDGYLPGPLVSKKYQYAKQRNVKVTFWPTMNNTHPWWPFASGKHEWLMFPEKRTLDGEMLSGKKFKETVQGNCIANRPFLDWVNRLASMA